MSQFYDLLEQRSPEQRETDLFSALPQLISNAQEKAPGWAKHLSGVNSASVNSRAALARLPVLRKSDLKELQAASLPFGGLTTMAVGHLQAVYMSPGPVFDAEMKGPDPWRAARALYAAGIRAGHVVQNCFGYHMTPGAWMVHYAAQKIGAAVIPAGTGQTEQQIDIIKALKPQAYIGTPSFLRIIIEKAKETGADISHLKNALLAAEALPPSLRTWFKEQGLQNVVQWYGTADLGLVAYETLANGELVPGMMVDEHLIVEIVRPGTGDPVADGEVGEIVVTSFNEAYPLIRFATGDMSAVLKGQSPCGRTGMRIKGWLGRADQTTKVRGMFVHPGQVAQIVKRHTEVARSRLVITGQMANDEMMLRCEVGALSDLSEALQAKLADAIGQTAKEVLKLRCGVELVTYASLPNDGKVIEDARSYE
jgi:phenylacetate-CoA ligase